MIQSMAMLAVFLALLAVQDWDRADRETKRLPPASVVSLPNAIRADLERRGCTIPQPALATEPMNVIRGQFTRKGQVDWAVLCSLERISSILVYRGGSTKDVADIEKAGDAGFLQVIGPNDQIGFSRGITVATSKHILEHYRNHGGPKPPPLDHDGIEDAFIEKGSSVLYWYQGRWLTLQGSD